MKMNDTSYESMILCNEVACPLLPTNKGSDLESKIENDIYNTYYTCLYIEIRDRNA